jgi:hypothetical protein
MDLFKRYEKRAPAEVLPASMPDPLPYYSEKNRNFVRETFATNSICGLTGRSSSKKPRKARHHSNIADR